MFLGLESVSVRYAGSEGDHAAVDSVSLGLSAGQIGVLIGPSGCGKTSLLRAVAGLEALAGGRIRMHGELLADADAALQVPPEERRIGMVFQDYALFPHLSGADTIAFGVMRLPRAQRAKRVAQMLDLVGLGSVAKRAPHQLSGGQQQRIALARALAPSPRQLLLDAPCSNLDVDLRERQAHEVRGILKETATTALFVTHDQLEAFALGDLIGVMRDGRLEQWDDAYALYHRPATRFVASFIGHGVFTPARIDAPLHGSAQVLTALGALRDMQECPLPDAYPGGLCDVLLRADDIVHDDASPVKAKIERKAFRGSEFLYTLRLASGERVLAHVPSHHDHQIGEWIGIRAEVDHVVTFASAEAAVPIDAGAAAPIGE
jgi:iron(III) transport system ATP-binding protein